MFFFDEDVEIDNVDVLPKDENEEDIFDNLESVVSDESAEEEQEVSSNDRCKFKIFN